MTTTFNNRRHTHQPMSVGEQEDVNGVYERHASPQKSVMQMFGENQRLHMARLSVPKDNRKRERFNGTQNTMFGTFTGEMPDASQLQMNKTVFNGSRKGSTGSFVGGSNSGPRVKSSLLGTSARQKLLKYRLEAYQAKVGVDNEARAQIIG